MTDSTVIEEIFLTEAEGARRWRLSPRTLQRWRSNRTGPPCTRLGARVVYALVDVIEYEQGARADGKSDLRIGEDR